MEAWSPETPTGTLVSQLKKLYLAIAEVQRLAGPLRDLHESDIAKAKDDLEVRFRTLEQINRRLYQEVDILKGSRHTALPHVAFEDFRQPPLSPVSPLQVDDKNDDEDLFFMCKPSKNGNHLAMPEAGSIVIKDVWLEAHGTIMQSVKDGLSFDIQSNQQRARKSFLKRGISLGIALATQPAKTNWTQCTVMNPVGALRMTWNFFCLLLILYDLFWIPLQVFDLEDLTFLDALEWVLTFFWTADVLMTFRTGYFVGAHIEMRPKRIAVHYAKTWLLVDIIIVVLEWMGRFMNVTSSASLLRSTRAARNVVGFVKLIRLAKMQSLWAAVQEQVNSNLFEMIWMLSFLCMSMVAMVHITACIWYAIGCADDGWTTYDQYEGTKNTIFWYTASARWVIAQLNGRTDMHEKRNMMERFFTCVMGILLALIAQALFLSIVTKTMIDLSELVSEKTRRRAIVTDYLEDHPLTPQLNSQVKRCLYEYRDIKAESKKEGVVMSVLPNYLQTDVLYQVRGPVIMNHSFFHSLRYESPWAMRLTCRTVIDLVPAAKCEVVFDKGDVCTRMLFSEKLSLTYGDPDSRNTFLPSLQMGSSATTSFRKGEPVESKESKIRRSVPNKTFSNLSPATFASRKGSQQSFEEQAFGFGFEQNSRKIKPGECVSEPALWTHWRNQGRLVSNSHGVMLGADSDTLANTLKKHPDAFAMATMYAEKFVEALRLQEELSDVLSFEVVTLAPALLNVTVISATGLDTPRDSAMITRLSRHHAFAGTKKNAGVFCICKVAGLCASTGEVRFATPGVPELINPAWYHSARVHLSKHQSLVFEVWGETLLGEARLHPEDFIQDGFSGDCALLGPKATGIVTVKVDLAQLTAIEAVHS